MKSRVHRRQGRSQEFVKGDKRRGLRTEVPSGVQGQSPGGGRERRSRRHMLNIRLNIGIDRHIAYCSESDYNLKKFPVKTEGHAPMSPPLGYAYATDFRGSFRVQTSALFSPLC